MESMKKLCNELEIIGKDLEAGVYIIAKENVHDLEVISVNPKCGIICKSKTMYLSKVDEMLVSRGFIYYLREYFSNEYIYNSFVDFLDLSIIFDETTLNTKDIFNIVKSIIKRNKDNLDSGNITISGIEDFLLKNANSKNLTYGKLIIKYELLEKNFKLNQNQISIISDLYADLNLFDREPFLGTIDDIIKNLRKLGLSEKYLEKIKAYMEKIVSKQENKNQGVEEVKKDELKISSKPLLTDKEYSSLKKELKQYYDPYTKEVKKEMSYEEILKVAKWNS